MLKNNNKQRFIFQADLHLQAHCKALCNILKSYMEDKMGGHYPLTFDQESKLIDDLKTHPSVFILLAGIDTICVGMAVCFINYSTFNAAPFINIHDLAVLPECRHQGIGSLLLQRVTLEGIKKGCSQITLEVRIDNFLAQKLYSKFEFIDCYPQMNYYKKDLPQCKIY